MTLQLTVLGWMLVLAIVQILLPAFMRNGELGVAYQAGPRDGPAPPPGLITARLQRAQANLFETLPLFAIGILIANIAHRDGALTAWGAILYAICRVLFVPIYAFGLPMVRSFVFVVSMIGLGLILFAILKPA
jgi:uncharacterized MAPEG superfamily protein